MGREYEGILRTTFITDDKGIITRVIDKVKTKDHTNQILNLWLVICSQIISAL